MTPLPKLRVDLSFLLNQEEDEDVYIVKDPITGEVFEFGAQEHFLMQRLSGAESAEDVLDDFLEEFGQRISLKDLQAFIAMLSDWGLLQDDNGRKPRSRARTTAHITASASSAGGPDAEPPPDAERPTGEAPSETAGSTPPPPARPAEAPRSGHYSLLRPNALFDALAYWLGPLRHIKWLLPVLLIFAAASLFFNIDRFFIDFGRYWKPLSLIQHLIFSLLTVNLASETARGVVARRLGADVPSFGLKLALGMIPRFETVLGELEGLGKRERLWIHASPILMRVALLSLGVILWQALRSTGTQLPALSLMVGCVAAITLAVGANPLLRSPGYDFLATWLDIPNLRQQANRALFSRLPARRQGVPADQDDQLALRIYALASFIFMFVMLGVLAWYAARWLELNYQGTGVAVFLFMLVYFVLNMRRQIKARLAQRRGMGTVAPAGGGTQGDMDWAMDMDDDIGMGLGMGMGGSMAGGMGMGRGMGMRGMGMRGMGMGRGMAPPPAPPPKPWPRWLKYGLPIILIIVALLPYPYETGGPATILPSLRQEIHAEREGIIEKVYFRGGEWVKKGTVVAKMASYDQQKNLLSTQANLAEREAELQKLLTSPTPEELALARQQLATAVTRVKFSEENVKRQERLYKEGFVSSEKYEDALRQLELDRAEVDEKTKNLELVEHSVHPQDIAAKRAEIERLRHDLDYYRDELKRTNLIMPIDGRLVTLNLHYLEGKYLTEGTVFATAEDDRTVPVEIAIPESDVSEIAIGRTSRLKVWTYPNTIFTGKVTEISPAVSEADQGYVIKAISQVPNEKGTLKSGMTGYAKVDGGTKPVIVAFTRMLVRFFMVEGWSWLP